MTTRLIDMTGQRVGSLVVLRLSEDRITPSGQRKKMWACLCDCGTETVVVAQNLRRGTSTSCGCYQRSHPARRRLDLTGQRFGRLTVRGRATDQRGRTAWLCSCDCGQNAVRLTKVLREGLARSCGCLQDEARRELREVVTYAGAHQRLRRLRGSAADYVCVDCGGSAADWSYTGESTDELVDNALSTPLRYSLNLDDYEPRCRSCHLRLDRAAS